MNRIVAWLGITFFMLVAPSFNAHAQDPITEIIRKGVIKVIKAVDLKIQRLQNKTIWVQNAQKVLENKMSQAKLYEISGWVEKQRVLYADYFEEMKQVKAAVAYYHKVQTIVNKQLFLVKEYRRVWSRIRQDRHFSVEEVVYAGKIYTGIINESLEHLDGIAAIISSHQTQMSDGARMELMDGIAQAMERNFNNLRAFNTHNIQLSLMRASDEKEVVTVKSLYGLH